VSETQNEVESQPVVTESAPSSFGESLNAARGAATPEAEAPEVAQPEPIQAAETVTEVVDPNATTTATTAAPEVPAQPQTEASKPQPQVPVSVLVSMREKARAAEQRAKELEAQLQGQYVPQADADNSISELRQQLAQQRTQLLEQSEILIRQAHPDYDDVVKDFYEEAAKNEALADTVLNSPAPALAAYQAGQNLRLAKKYGPDVLGNPLKLRAAIEGEIRADERKQAQADFQRQLSAKANERANTPTDIAAVRAQSGGTESYSLPSLNAALRRAQTNR
jgi:hypothetical protein